MKLCRRSLQRSPLRRSCAVSLSVVSPSVVSPCIVLDRFHLSPCDPSSSICLCMSLSRSGPMAIVFCVWTMELKRISRVGV
ncbi:hypothetical protein YC2023_065818 [Brassica napus]